MRTSDTSRVLARLFSELVDGASEPAGAFILNSGDIGLLRSLDKLSAADASRSVNDGATIAAHAQHVRYGLSLMNRWANEGGNPFADATWDEAWKTVDVDAPSGRRSETGCVTKRTAGCRCWAHRVSERRGAHRDGREHRSPGLSPRRDPADRQACAGAERGNVLSARDLLKRQCAIARSSRIGRTRRTVPSDRVRARP